jgi:hypothetical protein
MSTFAPSPATALYLSSLSDDLRADFQAALQATGLEGEIALLRVHIAKLNKREPDNLKLLLRAVHMIERLVKCGLQVDKEHARNDKPGLAPRHRRDEANLSPAFFNKAPASPRPAAAKTPERPAVADTASVITSPPYAPETVDPLPDQHTPVSAGVAVLESSVVPVDPPPTPAPVRTKWATSAVAKKAPAAKLPASAQFLFHKKKHKKH